MLDIGVFTGASSLAAALALPEVIPFSMIVFIKRHFFQWHIFDIANLK